MRKIITKDIKEKKERRGKIIISLILVALMVLSTAGYSFFSGSKEETEKVKYNGIEFEQEGGLWKFTIQNSAFLTQYTPEDTENISVPAFLSIGSYSNKPLFFSGQGPAAAKQEIARNLQAYVPRMQDVCIEGTEWMNECENDEFPIKNCSEDNVIIFKENEKEEIEIKEDVNCVVISAPYEEQARAADAFLFKILGV